MSFYVDHQESLSIGQAIYEAALILAILRYLFCFLLRFINHPRSTDHSPPQHHLSSSSSSSWDDVHNNLLLTTFGEILTRVPDTEDTCAVCLNDFKTEDQVRELMNCYHVFHKECIDRWLEHDHDTCPLCRAPLLSPYSYSFSSSETETSSSCVPPPQPNWAVESLLYLFGDDLLPY